MIAMVGAVMLCQWDLSLSRPGGFSVGHGDDREATVLEPSSSEELE